jgi:glycosyltransferase involved in cell wall biosynthesis
MTILILFHPMDPRGSKIGGIETHVRLVLARHPPTTSLLFVGIDEAGDCPLGVVQSIEYEGRIIAFCPVAFVPAETVNTAARRIGQSTTLRFALGVLRHIVAIRRAARGQPASCEIERFEFALFPKLLRLPSVLIVHNEGTREDKMDSLLKRFWFVHQVNERLAFGLADRIFAVNESIARRVAVVSPAAGTRTDVMSVSVDTDRFAPTPFLDGEELRVCFAGRLDDFKDPPLMVATLAQLSTLLSATPAGRFRRLAFDYVGASDPERVAGFAAIASLTTRHGIRSAAEVAAIMRAAHAGIITSFFEGMPCFLLEMLASGRPVAAIRLPQFEPLIRDGVSGALVDRAPTAAQSATGLAAAFHALAISIANGSIRPEQLAALAEPYSVKRQMTRLFAWHDALAEGLRA